MLLNVRGGELIWSGILMKTTRCHAVVTPMKCFIYPTRVASRAFSELSVKAATTTRAQQGFKNAIWNIVIDCVWGKCDSISSSEVLQIHHRSLTLMKTLQYASQADIWSKNENCFSDPTTTILMRMTMSHIRFSSFCFLFRAVKINNLIRSKSSNANIVIFSRLFVFTMYLRFLISSSHKYFAHLKAQHETPRWHTTHSTQKWYSSVSAPFNFTNAPSKILIFQFLYVSLCVLLFFAFPT